MSTPYDPAVAVAFSGHRPEKIFTQQYDPILEEKIRNCIYMNIRNLYQAGYRNFITGMARGFDLWAGYNVMLLKDLPEYSGMELTCAIPFAGQRERCDDKTIKMYDDVMDAADYHTIISPSYRPMCFHQRNDWMVDHSAVLLCYYNGEKGGTAYTVNKAIKAGHRVINIFDSLN